MSQNNCWKTVTSNKRCYSWIFFSFLFLFTFYIMSYFWKGVRFTFLMTITHKISACASNIKFIYADELTQSPNSHNYQNNVTPCPPSN